MLKPIITMFAAITITTACGSELNDDVEDQQAYETETATDSADEFRDACSPGFCCDSSRPMAGGTMYGDCKSASSAAECGGAYLSCESECYSGESDCHVGTGYNECCVGAAG